MSLWIFLTLCILGVDFLIYVLFQWTYGDKRQAVAKKLAAQRKAMKEETRGPVLVSSHRGGAETQARLRKVRARMTGSGARERGARGFNERLA